jgi:hypothetical protein
MEISSLTIIILAFLIISLGLYFFLTSLNKEKNTNTPPPYKQMDFVKGEQALKFLDRIIKEKYTFHLYAKLLPIYLDKKIPEKNIVQEVKEKIYVSVVGSLSKDVKKNYLEYFTEKGIEIYINEKIMIYMNETDFRTAEKYTESFRDLKPHEAEKLLP